ncbi:NAD-dependent epimerase/dehydratase family protein [Brevibacillus dissolubilis]|uniref:NAD-dependent epimerase/dehydratase family protein n=1 Tax=Brevibacillus dissolubilis TaxID=1844116 RepID=UPI0011163E26|nr:NAD-dependent epimerase/dehydratase family protein [Brevibacillus dissolubilis]
MKLLILGGTLFLGRHMVDAAVGRGHELTLFNRGTRNDGLYPQVEKLIGDRDGGLDALKGRRWDAVIDTCGYFPRIVRQSAELLANSVDHYTFVSSVSVYSDFSKLGIDESYPVGKLEDETIEEKNGDTYGPLKVLCEQAVEQAMPGRALVIRPGLIVGPHDSTDRFTYWPCRVARGGEVLTPTLDDHPIQIIDARDLAEWTIRMMEQKETGVYNVTGPEQLLPYRTFVEECRAVTGSDATFVEASDEFLMEQGVGIWTELPIWIPHSEESHKGFTAVDCTKALAKGLTFRPLADTIQATLDWANSRPADYEWVNGLADEKEQKVLNAWKERQGIRMNEQR